MSITDQLDVNNDITDQLLVSNTDLDFYQDYQIDIGNKRSYVTFYTYNAAEAAYNTLNEATGYNSNSYSSFAIDAEATKGVRRPYRGISIKKESFGTLAVVKDTNSLADVALKNSSVVGDSAFTSNFLVNSVSESRQEKHQPVPTFGKDYVYFFGEQPKQMTFNVTLLNTDNFRWEEEWWYNYENYFRGTRLAARSQQVRLRLDESIIYGYMVTCSTNKDSNNPHVVTLTFTVHVTDVYSTRPSRIGSDKVQEEASDAYGYIDMNATDVGSTIPTITIGKDSQAIRSANIEAYLKDQEFVPGAVSRFINGTKNKFETVSKTYQQFVDFIYGRNIVLPADAAYAQFSSGNPTFAEGTEAYNVLQQKGLLGETAVYGKTRGVPPKVTAKNSYTDNYDEYPLQGVLRSVSKGTETSTPANSVTDEVIRELSRSFNIPEDELRADEDGVLFSGTPQEKIREAREQAIKSRVAFGAFQIGISAANSEVRKQQYKKGKYKVFPNEVFAAGVVGLQYTK